MATTFSSLKVTGTATIATLVATAVTLTTVAITTGTFTTANITTANVQTFSGATISATDANDVIEGTTISGATLRNTAGTWVVDATDIESTMTFSGSTFRAISSFTGASVKLTPTTGTAALTIYGNAKGSHICIRDTDGAGWTEIDALNGTVTARIASAGNCP